MGFPRGRVVGGSSAVNTCIALRGHAVRLRRVGRRSASRSGRGSTACRRSSGSRHDLDFDNEWHGQSRSDPDPPTPAVRARAVAGRLRRGVRRARLPAVRRHERPDDHRRRPARDEQDRRRAHQRRARYLARGPCARGPTCSIHADTHGAARRSSRNGVSRASRSSATAACSRSYGDRVVLSAGAIATPGILLRSGIGPRRRGRASRRRARARRARASARACSIIPGVAIFFLPLKAGMSTRRPPAHPDGLPVRGRRAAWGRTTCSCSPDRSCRCPSSRVAGRHARCRASASRARRGRLRFTSARAGDMPVIETEPARRRERSRGACARRSAGSGASRRRRRSRRSRARSIRGASPSTTTVDFTRSARADHGLGLSPMRHRPDGARRRPARGDRRTRSRARASRASSSPTRASCRRSRARTRTCRPS